MSGSLGTRLSRAALSVLRRYYHLSKFVSYRQSLPRRRPCVVLFPSAGPKDAASNLRAHLIAPELEKLGWRAVVAPAALSLAHRRLLLRLEKPEVVFLQQTRHPLNQPKFYDYPCVLDADDADVMDPLHTERVSQSAADAAWVVGGSRFVTRQLGRFNKRASTIWTSTPRRVAAPRIPASERGAIVAWAHASPLGYPDESAFVQSVMTEVCRRVPCTFWLFGTEEQEATQWFAPIRAAGGICEAIPPMPYEAYLAKVADSAIGLQVISPQSVFSVGKSFGKILAYLHGEVAVVASNAVDHPLFFRSWENGVLVEDDVAEWADAIVRLLNDTALRARLGKAGFVDSEGRLTSDGFAVRLDHVLRRVAGPRAAKATDPEAGVTLKSLPMQDASTQSCREAST